MDKKAAFGYTSLVNQPNGPTRSEIQEMIRKDNQFAIRLQDINQSFKEDNEFESVIRRDLLSEKVYPYSESGVRKEIPKGSTVLDYIALTEPDKIDKYDKALVNEREVGLDYEIRNNDRIVLVPGKVTNLEGLNDKVKTEKAKSLIKKIR